VIEFAYREEYPNEGSWWEQPAFFNQLYNVARSEIVRLQKKAMEKR